MLREIWRKQPDMSNAITLAQRLEQRERHRVGSVSIARRRLADRLKVGIGTFENLVRGRVKRVDAAIRDRLQALLVQELEHEIARLTHELEIARQGGAHPGSQHVCEIETHLSKARAFLSGNVPAE